MDVIEWKNIFNAMNTKVCLKADGDPKRGRLIIAYLEGLGGKHHFKGDDRIDGTWSTFYYIDYRGFIDGTASVPKSYTLIDLPTIIGYKCPIDLWSGDVPQNSLFSRIDHEAMLEYEYEYEYMSRYGVIFKMPPEIVETWKPVFEQQNLKP